MCCRFQRVGCINTNYAMEVCCNIDFSGIDNTALTALFELDESV